MDPVPRLNSRRHYRCVQVSRHCNREERSAKKSLLVCINVPRLLLLLLRVVLAVHVQAREFTRENSDVYPPSAPGRCEAFA